MTTPQKIYVGDTGTQIILDCLTDISTATARSIEVRKPDGTTTSWAAVAEGSTSIKFATLAGSLDQSGQYRLQARVTLPSGVWRGETAVLTVYQPFG